MPHASALGHHGSRGRPGVERAKLPGSADTITTMLGRLLPVAEVMARGSTRLHPSGGLPWRQGVATDLKPSMWRAMELSKENAHDAEKLDSKFKSLKKKAKDLDV